MSLFASLVFEQSYGGVEGDSASLAELCALLSALSGLTNLVGYEGETPEGMNIRYGDATAGALAALACIAAPPTRLSPSRTAAPRSWRVT